MASPALTPAPRWRALSSRTTIGDPGTKKLPELLTRPRPFMNGGRGHPLPELGRVLWGTLRKCGGGAEFVGFHVQHENA